jgi:hypothetical protein
MKWGRGSERCDGLILDVLDELEGCWGEATVAVNDEGREGAAQGEAVGAVLGLFVAFASRHGLAWGEVAVGGGVGIYSREVK